MGGLFRGVRAPASLKQRSRHGAVRPGLIEATPESRPSGLFRGVRAPASLKLVRAFPLSVSEKHDYLKREAIALPGRTRPGLIEAVPGFGQGYVPGRPLPGRTRPGLIEASRCPAINLWAILFRGVRAPASLKR